MRFFDCRHSEDGLDITATDKDLRVQAAEGMRGALVFLSAETALKAANHLRNEAWKIQGHRTDLPGYFATAQLREELENAAASWGLPDWDRTRALLQRVGEHLEALLEVVCDQCGSCGAPTCHGCFTSCAVCGKQFCQRCADRVCPHHELDVAGDVQEVLAAEGFEDVGSDVELVADWTSYDPTLLRDCEANEWIEVRYLRGGCSGTFTHIVHTVLALDELLDDVPLADVEHIHLMRTLLGCHACGDNRAVSCENCGREAT